MPALPLHLDAVIAWLAPVLLASTEADPEQTRELVGQLLGFLGLTVGVVILLLVLGLPLRSWLRQRRDGDPKG